MDLGQLITDTETMKNGVWVPFMDDAEILVAKFDNPNYRSFIQGQRIENAAAPVEGEAPGDDLVDLMCRAMSETVLLGWRNFTIRGEQIEYSKEAAYGLLKKFDGLRNQVILAAQTQANFADEEFEEALDKIGPF